MADPDPDRDSRPASVPAATGFIPREPACGGPATRPPHPRGPYGDRVLGTAVLVARAVLLAGLLALVVFALD